MISHHHKCIFIHIPKNAGQSIEHVFLRLLGLNWDTRAPLLLRQNDRPELGPPRLAHLKWHEYVDCQYVPQEMFESYFKFAFVRNPWARVVSMYKYLGYREKLAFKDFLMGPFKAAFHSRDGWFLGPQSDYIYSDDGTLQVDFVGRFETLQDDFKTVCRKLGIEETQLPHVNRSAQAKDPAPNSGAGPKSYQDLYDQESIDCVAALYQRDVERLGYDFGVS